MKTIEELSARFQELVKQREEINNEIFRIDGQAQLLAEMKKEEEELKEVKAEVIKEK